MIIRRAIDGDESALRALWTRHAPHIDLVVRRLVGDDVDLAADIAQEVWIQIFRALPSYRGDSQFSTWAHRIAVNRTLNALRKTRRLASVEIDLPFNAPPDEMSAILVGSGTQRQLYRREIIRPVDQYTEQAEAFALAILEDKPVDFGIEDAISQMRVLDAIFRSEKSGTWENVK